MRLCAWIMLVIFYQIQYASSLHRLLGSFQDQDVRGFFFTSIIKPFSEINKINTGFFLFKLELHGIQIHFQTHVLILLIVHQSGQVEWMKQMKETLYGPEVTNLKTWPKIIRIIMKRMNIVFDFLLMESGVITITTVMQKWPSYVRKLLTNKSNTVVSCLRSGLWSQIIIYYRLHYYKSYSTY